MQAVVSKRFFASLALGFLLAAFLYLALFYWQLGAPTPNSQWAFEINARKMQIARETKTPKILFIGGSSTLFGIRAAQVERSTGLNAVNFGTHAALGPEYILQMARKVLLSNDIVVLIFEYELYDMPAIPKTDLFIDYILARDPEYFASLPLQKRLPIIMGTSLDRVRRGIKYRFKKLSSPQDDSSYSVKNIGNRGDQTAASAALRTSNPSNITNFVSQLAGEIYKSGEGFAAVRTFCIWCREHNIRVLASFPALYKRSEYESPAAQETAELIRRFYQDLDVPTLEDYDEVLYPLDSFFDTAYHLTAEAAERRTTHLIMRLKPALGLSDSHR